MNKIIVLLGPTATGKSDLAVRLAKKINGEIISADSRQVYKGLDIGSGKITKKETQGVPHYLLDVTSPKKVFSAADYKIQAEEAIETILKKGKVPILCGGTGFYIQSVVDNVVFPDVPPNLVLRKKLNTKSPAQLFVLLTRLDPARAKNIDAQNPRRLVRAIEIATALGKVPQHSATPKYKSLQIGITVPDPELREKIHIRLLKREKGMLAESKKLRRAGLSWKRMDELGLEYRFLARLLQSKLSREEFRRELEFAIWNFARRQKSWFRRDKRIHWHSPKAFSKIVTEAKKFLK